MSVHRSDDGQQDEFQTFLTVGLIRLRQCPCVESEKTIPGGIIQNCTSTYPVDGDQYIAVLTGYGISQTSGPLARVPDITPPRGHNAIYVFALP